MKRSTHKKTNAKAFYTLGTITLILFLLLTILVKTSGIHSGLLFDSSVQSFAYHLQSSAVLVTFFSHFTNLFGDTIGVGVTGVICLILFFLVKEKIGAIWLGLLVVASVLFNTVLKSVIGRVRPDTKRLTGFANEAGFSFASGHSTFTTVLFASLFLIFVVKMTSSASRFGWGLLALIMILLVMFSRIFVGVHYPTDTVGGFLEGIIFVLFTYPSYVKYHAKKYAWKILN